MFWKRYPALVLALSLLIGICSAFHLYFLICILFLPQKKLWIFSLCGYLYVKLLYPSFPESQEGTALFHIEEIKPYTGPFYSSLVYIGTLRSFQSKSGVWHRIPCRFYAKKKINRPKANKDYFIPKVELIQTSPYTYTIKSHAPWIHIEGTSSLAEWRYQIKEQIKKYLKGQYRDKRTYDLITAIVTGNVENRILSYQFSCVGLQHLLAISGFHFALLTFILTSILKRFLSLQIMAFCLIFLLSIYFFYIGKDPSVYRAWMGIMVHLVGLAFSYRPIPLNTFGIALLTALVINPLIITNIGFQLSFSATLGILMFYKMFEKKLECILPKRTFKLLLEMPILDQVGYLLCAYMRKVFALNGSVLIFTLPFLLFHFKTFPFLSIIYNLFFPFLFSLLIGNLLIGFVVPGINFINEHYAYFLLNLIAQAPKRFMFNLGIKEIGIIIGALSLSNILRIQCVRQILCLSSKD